MDWVCVFFLLSTSEGQIMFRANSEQEPCDLYQELITGMPSQSQGTSLRIWSLSNIARRFCVCVYTFIFTQLVSHLLSASLSAVESHCMLYSPNSKQIDYTFQFINELVMELQPICIYKHPWRNRHPTWKGTHYCRNRSIFVDSAFWTQRLIFGSVYHQL